MELWINIEENELVCVGNGEIPQIESGGVTQRLILSLQDDVLGVAAQVVPGDGVAVSYLVRGNLGKCDMDLLFTRFRSVSRPSPLGLNGVTSPLPAFCQITSLLIGLSSTMS